MTSEEPSKKSSLNKRFEEPDLKKQFSEQKSRIFNPAVIFGLGCQKSPMMIIEAQSFYICTASF